MHSAQFLITLPELNLMHQKNNIVMRVGKLKMKCWSYKWLLRIMTHLIMLAHSTKRVTMYDDNYQSSTQNYEFMRESMKLFEEGKVE